MNLLINGVSMCRFSSPSMVFACVAPLTHIVMTIRGLTFHPWPHIVFISGLYLSFLMAWSKYLSCVFYDLDGGRLVGLMV